MALGVSLTAAIFHLFTHAFFKACLFLGAGSVSHVLITPSTCAKWVASKRDAEPTRRLLSLPCVSRRLSFRIWSKDEILLVTGQENGYP